MGVAAIFDLDGTLVSFQFDIRGTRKALLDELRASSFDTTGLDLTTPTQQILDAAKSQATPDREGDYESLRKRVYSILDRFELGSVASASAFPGVREALQSLKSKGVRIAVLTNSGRKAATRSLQRAGLLECFELVLTRDDTDTMKPRPEGLTKAVSVLAVPKGDAYYVGDSPYDIAAAKKAGLKVVSVATGNYSAERLRSEGADYVIASMAELPGVLGV